MKNQHEKNGVKRVFLEMNGLAILADSCIISYIKSTNVN